MPEIKQLVLGQLATNCYIVWDARDKNNAVIIDPADSFAVIERFITDKNLTPVAVLLTHAHSDHTGAAEKLKREYPKLKVFIHEADADTPKSGGNAGNSTSLPLYRPFPVDERVKDGDEIKAGVMTFSVMHTPGHSKGSCCYVTGGVMFTGDTLFAGSVGRTDLSGGNSAEQRETLRRIAAIEDEYDVFPGHGETTTLSREKTTNPYFE